MNAYAYSVNTYKTQQVQTATPEELLILLYEGAIRFLNVSKAALAEQDLIKFNQNLVKAQRIVLEFMDSLDTSMDTEAIDNLYRLYDYLHYRLLQAGLKKDGGMIEEVLGHLKALKETWQEAIKIAQQEQSVETASHDNHAYQA